jgi:hypothetical protein
MGALTNPQVLAALRNVLSALGGALAILGITTLSPAMIQKIIDFTQAMGVLIGAVATLLGLVVPAVMAAIAQFKASPLQQAKTVTAIASDPANASAPDAKLALMTGAMQAAQTEAVPVSAASDAVKIAAVNQVARLPEVDKVVAPSIASDARTDDNVTKT